MPIDAYRNGNAFYVHFDLPGVDPASIDLTVEQNVLAVKAERLSIAADGAEMIVRELPAGTFTRQLFLGETFDADHIEADCNAGRLPSASRSWRRPSLASSSSPPTSTTSSCAAALSPEPHPPRLRPALGQRRWCSAGWGRHRGLSASFSGPRRQAQPDEVEPGKGRQRLAVAVGGVLDERQFGGVT